jgi:hypothetical protein
MIYVCITVLAVDSLRLAVSVTGEADLRSYKTIMAQNDAKRAPNRGRSPRPVPGARFVGRVNVSGKLLARPHSARERNIDLSLAR